MSYIASTHALTTAQQGKVDEKQWLLSMAQQHTTTASTHLDYVDALWAMAENTIEHESYYVTITKE